MENLFDDIMQKNEETEKYLNDLPPELFFLIDSIRFEHTNQSENYVWDEGKISDLLVEYKNVKIEEKNNPTGIDIGLKLKKIEEELYKALNDLDVRLWKERKDKEKEKIINEFVESKPEDKGEISDGYHTFNELYEYRKLYNAALFNEWYKNNRYDVHKSKRHHNGEKCFGGEYFIVVAMLPTGQISNHYKLEDWDLFKIKKRKQAKYPYDGHTPQDVADRLREFLTGKPKSILSKELIPVG
jgi:hypothetical protein